MGIETLNFLLQEETKSTYLMVINIVREMSNEEYDNIPIFELSGPELGFVKKYAICDIPQREADNFLNKKPYYDLYYVAPTLFKVKNKNE